MQLTIFNIRRLDGELSKLKISIGDRDMHSSQHLDYASIRTEPIEYSTDVSDAEEVISAGDDSECANI